MKIFFSSHELEGTGIRLTQIEAESDNAINTVWVEYQVSPGHLSNWIHMAAC